MARYMLKASYTVDGAKGLMKDGGSGRRAAVEKMIEGLGGRLECFYFTCGDGDAFAIVEVPDLVDIAAASLAINATGAARATTTALLSAEEIDRAARLSVAYRSPGG